MGADFVLPFVTIVTSHGSDIGCRVEMTIVVITLILCCIFQQCAKFLRKGIEALKEVFWGNNRMASSKILQRNIHRYKIEICLQKQDKKMVYSGIDNTQKSETPTE
jgi:hypothetical protein